MLSSAGLVGEVTSKELLGADDSVTKATHIKKVPQKQPHRSHSRGTRPHFTRPYTRPALLKILGKNWSKGRPLNKTRTRHATCLALCRVLIFPGGGGGLALNIFSVSFSSWIDKRQLQHRFTWSVPPRVPEAKLVEAHASVGTQSSVFKRMRGGFIRQVRRVHLLLEMALQSSRARPSSEASVGFDLEQNLIRPRLSSKGKAHTTRKRRERLAVSSTRSTQDHNPRLLI